MFSFGVGICFFPKPGQHPPSCLEGWGDVTYGDSSARMKRVEEGSQMMELETVYIYIYLCNILENNLGNQGRSFSMFFFSSIESAPGVDDERALFYKTQCVAQLSTSHTVTSATPAFSKGYRSLTLNELQIFFKS